MFSALLAFGTSLLCLRRVVGRVLLVIDVVVKVASTLAFGLTLGFEITAQVSDHANAVTLVEAVWFRGAMSAALVLTGLLFEVSFLAWRRKSDSGERYQELSADSLWKM